MKSTASVIVRRFEPLDQKGLEELHKQALAQLAEVEAGDCFTLEDLFIGYFWNKLQPVDRKNFGRFFSFYAQEQGKKAVAFCGFSSRNQIIYKKL